MVSFLVKHLFELFRRNGCDTKKCPECQAMCFNAPATCPYCGADLKGVAPIPPEELEKMLDKE